MDYLVGCMSYIFFCVTNFLFEKFNGVGHPKNSGFVEILGDEVTFLAELALRKALIRIDVAHHM